MLRSRTLAPIAAVVALLALAACSSDKGNSSTSGVAGSTTAAGQTPDGGNTAPSVEAPAPPTDTSGGYCNVKVTGDINAEWTSGGGYSAVGYGPWIPAEAAAGSPFATDETFFILNCQSAGANYVGFGPVAEFPIPMQPASYVIGAGDNAFGASESGQISVLITFEGSETNWGPVEDGQFIITEFDENHIAGTFSVTVTDVLADLGGNPSEGTATITGEFNFTNPNG